MSGAIKAYDSRLHQSNQGLRVQQSHRAKATWCSDGMDHSVLYFSVQFSEPASPKVIVKFTTNHLNFSYRCSGFINRRLAALPGT